LKLNENNAKKKLFIMKPRYGILIFVFAAVFSCKTTNEITCTNLAANYSPTSGLRLEGLRTYHETDSLSRVYLQYSTANFKYLKTQGKDFFGAEWNISYRLFSSYESNTLIDQGYFFISDSLHFQNPVLMKFDFGVAAKFPNNYLLEVKLSDLNAGTSILYPVPIEKTTKESAQNFLPININNEVIPEDQISWKTKFRIQCSNPATEMLYVSYYNRDFVAAAPPFSQARPQTYDAEPDDEFTVKVSYGISEIMQFAKEGFFNFKTIKNENSGLTLFRFHDYFPEVKKPEQLAPPLRYLTSNKEFEKILQAQDVKQAVDSFWLATAGNEQRAENIISKYYGRVVQANKLFSSHKEGWKTDRGMLYIIFGEPKTVYQRADIETWIYGEQGNRVFLTFDFVRAINPYTNNDFELQRRPEFKEQWYNAVLFWRQ